MRLFNNHWFRWFAGAFTLGALLAPVAFTTDQFKNLEIGAGKSNLSGTSAWVAVTLSLGIVSGALGLGVAVLQRLVNSPV